MNTADRLLLEESSDPQRHEVGLEKGVLYAPNIGHGPMLEPKASILDTARVRPTPTHEQSLPSKPLPNKRVHLLAFVPSLALTCPTRYYRHSRATLASATPDFVTSCTRE